MSNKLCLTCEKTFEKTGNNFISKSGVNIPLWFKEIGNYSLLPPPINNNRLLNPFVSKLVEFHPNNFTINIKVDLHDLIPNLKKYNSRWIYYWAAEKRNYKNTDYLYAPIAYGDFSNSGLVKSDKDGKFNLRVENPMLYYVGDNAYPPHIHFTYLNKDNTWNTDSFAIIVTPEVNTNTFNKLLKSNKYLAINADPESNSIPGTYNIPYNTTKELDVLIENLVVNNPNFHKFHKLYETPLIIYSNKNDISQRLVKKLRNKGYINVIIHKRE